MDLKQLQKLGAFVPSKTFTREVKFRRPVPKPQKDWADPEIEEYTGEEAEESMTVHIRLTNSADSVEMLRAPEKVRPFLAVHQSIVTPDGEPVFESLDQALRLRLWLAMPLFEAITEVMANVRPKASRRSRSSGAKSRLASAAAASESGKASST